MDVLREQVEYYRARAGEYDNMLDRGSVEFAPLMAATKATLDELAPLGDVLELACGTGWWTGELASRAASVTAIDAAPEMIERNRARHAAHDVRYVVADLFQWTPDRQYDIVFFGFWLSHVPREAFAPFWEIVAGALRPDGRVVFVDDHWEPRTEGASGSVTTGSVTTRVLEDQRTFRIVKELYQPAELESMLRGLGWDATVTPLGRYHVGVATRGE